MSFSMYDEYVKIRKDHPGKPISKADFDNIENALKKVSQVNFPEGFARFSALIDKYFSYLVEIDGATLSASIVTNEFIEAIKKYNNK